MPLPADHPVTASCAALAHRINVTRLRLAQQTSLAELTEHLEALIQDATRTLTRLDEHPDHDDVVVITDLGPDADFLARLA
jgi:hypothetical protein